MTLCLFKSLLFPQFAMNRFFPIDNFEVLTNPTVDISSVVNRFIKIYLSSNKKTKQATSVFIYFLSKPTQVDNHKLPGIRTINRDFFFFYYFFV